MTEIGKGLDRMGSIVRELESGLDIKINTEYAGRAERNIKLLHENDDGYICLAEKTEKKYWSQYHYKYENLIGNIGKAVSGETNIYMTPNSFYKPYRRIENIRHLNSLYIDIDYYKIDEFAGLHHTEIMSIVEEKIFNADILPKPTFILYTGNGLAYYWLIKPCPIKVLPLWNVCQRYFVEKLQEFGGDTNSIDSARVMKLAGSYHTKNKTRAELYILDKNLVYDLGEIQENYLPELSPNSESVGDRVHKRKHYSSEEYYEKVKNNAIKHSRSRKSPKVLKIYNQLNLHYTRLMDLVMLQELRQGLCRNAKGELVETGGREFMCFLYRYWYCLYSSDIEQALECTKEFNNNFKSPLTEREVESITVSAVKAYEQWKADEEIKNNADLTDEQKAELMGKKIGNSKYYHKGYNYNNSTLIRKLHISEEEQKKLQTIISKTERKNRQSRREKSKRRSIDGLTPKQAEKMERLEEVEKLYNKGLKQIEIAEKLGFTKGTISKDIKIIKDRKKKSRKYA